MSQHDYDIATADANTGASFRAAVNAALQAQASSNSGATAPATTYPYQLWVDTSASPAVIKMRDGDNADWVTIGTVDSAGNAFLAANADKLDGLSSADFATAAQGAAANAALPAADYIGRNRLINGDFRVNKRDVTSAADDAYIYDRWYVLTESGNVTVGEVANAENGTPTMLRLTQPDVTAKRIGIAQIIESKNCIDLRGKQVTFRLNRFRCSASQAIRWAILEWTGTADTVTSDVVNNWTSTTYAAGNFFLAANVTVAGTGTMTPSSNTLTTGNKLTATISGSANNLIVMVWTEGTLAQNGTLDLAKLQLEEGGNATTYEVRYLEMMLCQRYYERVEANYGTTVQAGGVFGVGATATAMVCTVQYKVSKRAVPNITIIGGGNQVGRVRNSSTGAVVTMGTVGTDGSGVHGFSIITSSTAVFTVGQTYDFGYVADAEL